MSEKKPPSRGRISAEQIEWIRENCYHLSIEDMASELGKKPETIREIVEDRLLETIPRDVKAAKACFGRLRDGPAWKVIAKHFFPEEVELFQFHFESIVAQFKGDVPYTEQLQIIEMCNLELYMDRLQNKIFNAEKTIRDTQLKIVDIQENEDPDDPEYTTKQASLLNIIGALNQSIVVYSKDMKEFFDKKHRVMTDLKGTREQRTRRLEGNKATLADFYIQLAEDIDKRNILSREMEVSRIANLVEFTRLSEYHKYCDGQVEQVILSSDTLKEDNI